MGKIILEFDSEEETNDARTDQSSGDCTTRRSLTKESTRFRMRAPTDESSYRPI